MKNEIPAAAIDAASFILRPYGVDVDKLINQQEKSDIAPVEKEWLSTREAIQYTGLCRWSLWKAHKDGKIKVSKLNKSQSGKILFSRSSIDSWLKSCSNHPAKA